MPRGEEIVIDYVTDEQGRTTVTQQCQDHSQCWRDAVWGLYAWKPGETNVNLKKPVRVYCGQHKPKPQPGELLRCVRLPR